MAFIPPHISYSGVYRDRQLQAQKAFQDAQASIGTQRQQLRNQFGLRSKTGGGFEADPYSQYGAVQQLKQRQGSDLSAAWDDASARGVGHVGLGAQREHGLRYAHGAQSQELGNQFTQGLSDLDSAALRAEGDYRNTMMGIDADSIRDAIANRMFNTPDYSGLDPEPSPYAQQMAKTIPIQNRKTTIKQRKQAAKAAPLRKYGWGAAATYAKRGR
jgi:hypothetical protein